MLYGVWMHCVLSVSWWAFELFALSSYFRIMLQQMFTCCSHCERCQCHGREAGAWDWQWSFSCCVFTPLLLSCLCCLLTGPGRQKWEGWFLYLSTRPSTWGMPGSLYGYHSNFDSFCPQIHDCSALSSHQKSSSQQVLLHQALWKPFPQIL